MIGKFPKRTFDQFTLQEGVHLPQRILVQLHSSITDRSNLKECALDKRFDKPISLAEQLRSPRQRLDNAWVELLSEGREHLVANTVAQEGAIGVGAVLDPFERARSCVLEDLLARNSEKRANQCCFFRQRAPWRYCRKSSQSRASYEVEE